jgi:hypothetical protein
VNAQTAFRGSDVRITVEDRYTLSDDGKILTQATHIESDSGQFDTTKVFEKQ